MRITDVNKNRPRTMSKNKLVSRENSASLKVSVCIQDVINHLDFLKSIEDEAVKFYSATYVQNSIRRYEKFWLPFVVNLSKTPDDDIKYAPPLGMMHFSCVSCIT